MPIISESLSVWDIAHRWAGYDPDVFRLKLPMLVKDYSRILFNEILEAHLFCETLIQAKLPSDSKADPNYYIRSHLDDINMCIWGKRYKRSLMKWAVIPRHEFEDWCGRYSINLPEFWFPAGWNRDYECPWYGPRAYWVYHIEPEFAGGFGYGFDIPGSGLEEGELPTGNLKQDSPDELLPSQQAKFMAQRMAIQLWKEHPHRTITDMAKDADILKYSGANHYLSALPKWLSEIAPKHIKGKRGRPRKKPDSGAE